jgi:hypothetical protein
MLQGSHPSNLTMPTANYQEYLQEKQLYDQQQQQHNLLKQHIRKTVLTRARNTSAQLEEAVEVDDSAEVISFVILNTLKVPPNFFFCFLMVSFNLLGP